MKNWILVKWSVGLALAGLPLAGGCQSESPDPPPVQTNTAITSPAVAGAVPVAAAPVVTGAAGDMSEQPPPADLEDAPLKPVEGEKPQPVSVRTTGPTAEIVKMANAGVNQSVMLTFVTNSPSTFNLGADEIIYLNDLGVPADVVTAMIQHDQALKANAAAALNAGVPVYTAPTNPAPATLAPEQVAPQATAPAPVYPAEPVAVAPATVVTYPTFYSSLSPYGTWMEIPGYGMCWQPTVVTVNYGWSPYVDSGRWIYSDWGWYWYSDYSWGWAPFHYGRWFRHHRHGWCWVPGETWGAAWVSWRYTDSYCGWAALPPGASFSIGIGWTFGGRHVDDRYHFGLHEDSWHFVATARMQDRHLRQYAMSGPRATVVYRESVVANRMEVRNNRVINRGIGPERVEEATHARVRPVTIRPMTASAGSVRDRGERLESSGKTLSVYRPPVTTERIATRPAAVRPDSGVYRGTRPNLEARERIESTPARVHTPAISSPKGNPAPAEIAAPVRPTAPTTATAPTASPTYRQAPPVTTGGRYLAAPRPQAAPPAVSATPRPSTTTTPTPSYSPSAPSVPRYTAPPAAAAPQRPTPSYTPAPATPRYSAPSAATAPQRPNPTPSAPSYAPAPATPRYSAPPAATAPQRPTPTPSAPSYTPSAPSVPRYSAPSQPSYSPPVRSAPTESRSYSAPSPPPQRSYSPPPSSSESRPSRSESSGNRPGGRQNQN